MRPKHPHAAESGVGKHTARESERAQACATGKERVANAHSHTLAPEAAKLPGPFCFYGRARCNAPISPRCPPLEMPHPLNQDRSASRACESSAL